MASSFGEALVFSTTLTLSIVPMEELEAKVGQESR